MGVQPRDRCQQGRGLGVVASLRRRHEGRFGTVHRRVGVEDRLGEGAEGAVRAQFQERGDALAGQVGDALVEVDGPADVPGPVGGVVVLVGGRGGSGDVGDHRDLRVAEGVAGEQPGQMVGVGLEDRVGVGAVEGMGDLQGPGADPGGRQRDGHPVEGVAGSGEGGGGG